MGSNSLKDYLKRYESNAEEEKKSKKKKSKKKTQPQATGLLVVDEDPTWQKPIDLGEEKDDNSSDEEKPLIEEDIEVKRMKRLEQLRVKRHYNAISEDGSGWVSLSSNSVDPINSTNDMSPPRKRRVRNDTPSPEPESNRSTYNRKGVDLSPSHQRLKRYDTPSPEHHSQPPHSKGLDSDFSPPRRHRVDDDDLSPPRKQNKGHPPSSESAHAANLSPDISPPRRPQVNTTKNHERTNLRDLSPPRRGRHDSPFEDNSHGSAALDLSNSRISRKDVARSGLSDHTRGRSPGISVKGFSRPSLSPDLSPPRKNQKDPSIPASVNERKTGLISGKDIREEIDRKKKDDMLRFKLMDTSISGRGAEPVYRDKIKGVRISKEEYLKSKQKVEGISKEEYLKSKQKVEEKPKEIEVEWGKGLAQKREAEAKMKELELEKETPFARTRDDPQLDKMLKERLRWGDPMAHLVKKKYPEPVLMNFGESDKMKESGFVVPQDIPSHSWLKRGLEAAPNRYGIRPGRHWDGVDRSNGYEKQLFKRTNERQAKDKEAYLWSVSDM